ncbi:MAG TPA: FtsX-like permease family protein [Rhodanobacteraceae bacterium]
MNLPPVIAALRKHKAGVFLIGLQIALTLAIVSNLVFIAVGDLQRIDRPTGLNGHDLFIITQRYVNAPPAGSKAGAEKLDAMQLTDLAALRDQPDVASATAIDALPLGYNGNTGQVGLKPDRPHGLARISEYSGDAHTLKTLGLQLVAGRNFTPEEVQHVSALANFTPSVVLMTRALADKLFSHGNALGQAVYLDGASQPSTVVGILANLLSSNPDARPSDAFDSILMPVRYDSAATMYAVRARPGRMAPAMHEARAALHTADPLRVIRQPSRWDPEGIAPYSAWARVGHGVDLIGVKILLTMSVILLLITGIGMTGLTSFWVRQRHKQIGIRRALGATRANIVHYFQIENLIIAGGGCVAGIVLAIAINLGLMRMFAMQRMPVWYVVAGVVAILLLGQIAVFMPARRASKVPPVVATRSV